MKKIYRQLLLFSSSVVFMAIAPLAVFYAMGYRVGIDADDTLPVGVLLIETQPRRAEVTVDGKAVGTTPRSVSNLPPGEITVSLSREGFTTWSKRLLIESTVVTELRDVRLFPEQRQITTLLNNPESFSLSPNRQFLAIITPDTVLHVINEEGLPIISPTNTRVAIKELLWSPDSNRLLLLGDNTTSVIDITDRIPRPRRLPLIMPASQITWDPRIPGRLLVINSADELIAYNIATDATIDLASNVHTFATSSRHIYIVGRDRQKIDVHNLQGQLIKSLTFAVDQPIDRLFVTPGGQVALHFADTSLAVLDEDESLLPVADTVLRAGWSPNEQILYIQTDATSLHVFNAFDERLSYLPLKQLHLVLRLSRPIRSPQWFAGGHHLIYQVDDEIIITEIDIRDHPISYTVDSTNLGKSLATVGQDGDTIFYLKRTEAGDQLVTASLVTE